MKQWSDSSKENQKRKFTGFKFLFPGPSKKEFSKKIKFKIIANGYVKCMVHWDKGFKKCRKYSIKYDQIDDTKYCNYCNEEEVGRPIVRYFTVVKDLLDGDFKIITMSSEAFDLISPYFSKIKNTIFVFIVNKKGRKYKYNLSKLEGKITSPEVIKSGTKMLGDFEASLLGVKKEVSKKVDEKEFIDEEEIADEDVDLEENSESLEKDFEDESDEDLEQEKKQFKEEIDEELEEGIDEENEEKEEEEEEEGEEEDL